MEQIFEVRSLGKSFLRDGKQVKIIEDMDLDVYRGEILCIMGRSGCGKSTLLRQIAGIESQDEGKILMNGREVTKPDVSRFMVFQDFNQLLPWKTVLKNLIYPMKVNKIGGSEKERMEIAANYLDMVGLQGYKNSYPYQLSGGMKQKAAIARALSLSPQVLLMDEPFGSLDALTRASLQDTLLEIWANTKVTIIFVTHDIQEAVKISDRTVVMGNEKGRIQGILKNNLKRPRGVTDKAFSDTFRDIYQLLEA